MYDEKAGRLRESIKKEQYAGMVVYADMMSPGLKKELDGTDIPYVMLDCYDPDIRASSVTVNNRQGIYTAVRYLLEKGILKSDMYLREHPAAPLWRGAAVFPMPVRIWK